MRAFSGFTLVEILVVLFIMSIVTSVALLSINQHENRQLRAFTSELVQKIRFAEELAILQPSVLGLSIKDNTYQFAHYQSDDEKNISWQPTQDKLLTKVTVPVGMQLSLEVGGKKTIVKQDSPQLVISTNGGITPFKLFVGKKGKTPSYMILGDEDGNITSKLLT